MSSAFPPSCFLRPSFGDSAFVQSLAPQQRHRVWFSDSLRIEACQETPGGEALSGTRVSRAGIPGEEACRGCDGRRGAVPAFLTPGPCAVADCPRMPGETLAIAWAPGRLARSS